MQTSWRGHYEWELQGSREARENWAGSDNGAHIGKGGHEPEEEAVVAIVLYHDRDAPQAGRVYTKPAL